MRIIKFRAFCQVCNKYSHMFDGFTQYNDGIIYQCENHYVRTDTILEQYTGLFDSTENEIYEGDVLRSFHFKGQGCINHFVYHSVEWSDKYSCWYMRNAKTKPPNDDGCCQAFVYLRNSDDIKIIGNIHENPELLNG